MPDEFLARFYRTISFGPGEPFPADGFRALFHPNALLLERTEAEYAAKTVKKSVRELMVLSAEDKPDYNDRQISQLTKLQRMEAIAKLEKDMREAAKMLEFEVAAALRDQIIKLRGEGK